MSDSAPPPPPPSAPPPPPPPTSPPPPPPGLQPLGQVPNGPGASDDPTGDIRKDNPIALASLIVGSAALVLAIAVVGGFVGLVAVAMAWVGLRRAKAGKGGRGMALGGIVLGVLSIAASVGSAFLIAEAIDDGLLTLDGFNPDPASAEFPVDDDLIDVECTEDGLALAIISVENNTTSAQRYTVTVTWDNTLGETLTGEARSNPIDAGESDEIRIFERSSSAIVDSCELTDFGRVSASLG